MRWSLIGAILVLMAVSIISCRMGPVLNVEGEPITLGTGEKVTLQQIEKAIRRAGASRGWVMAPQSLGHLVGTLNQRQHIAVVDVTFDTKSYSIRYKDSTNLKYDGTSIKRNYNNWIKFLTQSINRELAGL